MANSNKNKGGFFIKGNYHSEGGIPLVVKGSGQAIEVEKDEALISGEAMKSQEVIKLKGTNVEVLDKINKSRDNSIMSIKFSLSLQNET